MNEPFLYLQKTEFFLNENTEYLNITKHVPNILLHQGEEKILSYWVGDICSALINRFQNDPEVRQIIEKCFSDCVLGTINEWYEFAFIHEEQCESFLDKLDDLMKVRNTQICFIHSDLDQICDEREELCRFIRELIQFWFIHNGRFLNIKGKIFLREDMYNKKIFGFADASKINIILR